MLNKRGGKDILVIGSGIIPQKDKKLLEKRDIHGNFRPGTPLSEIIEYIRTKYSSSRSNR